MRYTLLLLLLLFPFISNAQVNLVPNPSFEDTNYCPNGLNRLEACKDWYNFGNSPDYFNACSSTVGVPSNGIAFQEPKTGNAMIGLITFANSGTSIQANYREFVGAKLNIDLLVGQEYFISFYTNFSFYPLQGGAISSNKLGVKFSTISYDSCCRPALTNNAIIHTQIVLSDSMNWTCIKGDFIADSAYNYIILGNFFDDNHTDTINFSATNNTRSYYFIDDVCVSTDSSLCYKLNQTHTNEQITTITLNKNNELIVSSNELINTIEIYDLLGRKLLKDTVNNILFSFDLEPFASSIYIVKIESNSKSFIKKFFKP